MRSWRSLEEHVRVVASLNWDCVARAEHIKGVDFDAVLRPEPGTIVLIEITQNNTLEKIRNDVAKHAAVRLSFIAEGIFPRQFIVTSEPPTHSMISAGQANHVRVTSVADFEHDLFDFQGYVERRNAKSFGSAIDPFTGESDKLSYIPVNYSSKTSSAVYSLTALTEALIKGKKIVLLGDFGTGKSRCLRELFCGLRTVTPCIAIDLRNHWGARHTTEIIHGHLASLSIDQKGGKLMKMLQAGAVVTLLDGFDEVGTQVIYDNPDHRKKIRAKALEGVRRLIEESKGGVLVSGRSHYFDNDDELLDALGLHHKDVEIIECAGEFSEVEMHQYLEKVHAGIQLPKWLPRKPLVCHVLASLNADQRQRMIDGEAGDYEFWGTLLDAICERESRTAQAIPAPQVRKILSGAARFSRSQPQRLGWFTQRHLTEIFEMATGQTIDDDGTTMLMRLCALGRVSSETMERQFIDEYILDGLRAEASISAIDDWDLALWKEEWRHEVGPIGTGLLIQDCALSGRENRYLEYLNEIRHGRNEQAGLELIAAMLSSGSDKELNLRGMLIRNANIGYLDLSRRKCRSLTLDNCYIGALDLSDSKIDNDSDFELSNCSIGMIYGITDKNAIPAWMASCEVEATESVSNPSKIKAANLSEAQGLLVSIIHRIFFQPGKARKEAALLKGFGSEANPRLAHAILNCLIAESIINKAPGQEGSIYSPNRAFTRRMGEIRSQLTLSKDAIWLKVSSLDGSGH